jgi:hypothetical protein
MLPVAVVSLTPRDGLFEPLCWDCTDEGDVVAGFFDRDIPVEAPIPGQGQPLRVRFGSVPRAFGLW